MNKQYNYELVVNKIRFLNTLHLYIYTHTQPDTHTTYIHTRRDRYTYLPTQT